MEILITGAAGNLGSLTARHFLGGPHALRLLIHKKTFPFDLTGYENVSTYKADLADPATLKDPVAGADCIVHFAGVLFAPWPKRFLKTTNYIFVKNLVDAALSAGVRKFVLISFPHVEGETTPANPAAGRLNGKPTSIHAKTRLLAEKYLLSECEGTTTAPVVLRSGMVYARGVLMVEAARRLLERRLLGVWPGPTWVHLLSLPDFLGCVSAAVKKEGVRGIYNLGDDEPVTLQRFLDAVADYWGFRRPWRVPKPLFYIAAFLTEVFASMRGTAAPLTRDFIRIGSVSYFSDTSRMKADLVRELRYPSWTEGLSLL